MIKAALVVQSSALSLDEISEAMAREPDAGYDRGSLAPVRGLPREWSSWSVDLDWPQNVHRGTEGLAVAIEALGLPLAERAANLASRGCDVVVSIHQELTGSRNSAGLHLTPAAISWLAIARAAVSVDQYVDGET